MGQTLAEKIIASHCGEKQVFPGQLVNARVDMALGNDITAPVAIKEFKKIGIKNVFDKERIALVPDHFVPNKDIQSAEQALILRNFAHEQNIKYYYEVGKCGIEHALLPEQGLTLPGEVIIGADSHTCTYGALGAFATGVGSTDLAAVMALGEIWLKVPASIKIEYKGSLPRWVGGKDLILYTIGKIGVDGALYKSLEFCGEAVKNLSMDGRMTISNMAVEAGAKCGLIEPDDVTFAYLEGRAKREYTPLYPDGDAEYEQKIEWDISEIQPQVACPHLPENTRTVSECSDIAVDQVLLGSCTNGRISDLRKAAEILKGKQVHPHIRMIVIPATQDIYLQAIKEGLLEIFVRAGAVVSAPTCGPCLGGHMGVLASGERVLSTTNRNFVGRMGAIDSEIYLAGPEIAAATAITGKITHPGEVSE